MQGCHDNAGVAWFRVGESVERRSGEAQCCVAGEAIPDCGGGALGREGFGRRGFRNWQRGLRGCGEAMRGESVDDRG